MHLISNGTQVNATPTPNPVVGLPGYWENGVPGIQNPTVLDADWLNAVQSELAGIVTAAGLVLDKTNGTQVLAALRLLFLSRGLGSYPGFTVDAVAGTRGFTVPANIFTLRATVLGGGGGGGGANPNFQQTGYYLSGAGGGSGGFAVGVYAVTPGEVLQYTVGAGGLAGIGSSVGVQGDNAGNGGAGGTTSVAALIAASGGSGGSWPAITSAAGGMEGLGYNGQLVCAGGFGSDGQNGIEVFAGNGGASHYGSGGRAGAGGGLPGYTPGSGGGGGYASLSNGGPGASGLVIFEF